MPKGELLVKLVEPPLAEPHERWCERSEISQLEKFPPTRLSLRELGFGARCFPANVLQKINKAFYRHIDCTICDLFHTGIRDKITKRKTRLRKRPQAGKE